MQIVLLQPLIGFVYIQSPSGGFNPPRSMRKGLLAEAQLAGPLFNEILHFIAAGAERCCEFSVQHVFRTLFVPLINSSKFLALLPANPVFPPYTSYNPQQRPAVLGANLGLIVALKRPCI